MLKPSVLAIVLLLVGCASMAPDFQAPALPVPAAYPADALTDPAATPGQRAAALDWREHFADPRLQQLIAEALQNNRDLRLAALRVQEARAAYGIQRAERFPVVGASGDASRARVPASLSTTGRAVVGSQYQVALGVNAWEIDFWGRVQSLQDAALQSYLASDAARRALTLSLVAQVADGYLLLRELDERLALARRSIASRAESLRIFTRRFEVGSTSRLDLAQVQTLSTQARALGAQLEQQRAVQAHALAQLVGGPVDLAPATTPLDDGAVLQPLDAGLPSALLADRPDILAAEHRLRAANANIGAARAAFFPRIALTTNAGVANAQLDALFEGASRPGHFRGVLTVVAKLFGLVRPDVAVFGEKDYQQLALIRRMVADLCMGIEIVGGATDREPDGLARSSRNRYLDAEQRQQAVALSRALRAAQERAAYGVPAARWAAMNILKAAAPGVELDYLALTTTGLGELPDYPDAGTEGRVLVAARVGTTRLIDNLPLQF